MIPLSTKTTTLLLVGLLAALPLAGCIENMQDLKDRLGTEEGGEQTTPASTTEADLNETAADVATNATANATKPPVARITVFGAAGALIYKSSFEAADPADPIPVKAPVTLQLLGSDSEALEPGATIADYSWDFAGMAMTGAKVEHELTEPGMYNLSLTVKDSKGATDTHNVSIAVAPEPFDVVLDLVTGPVVGAEEQGLSGSASFDITDVVDEKSVTAQQVVITTKRDASCADMSLYITAPDGTETKVDDAFIGDEKTTITLPAVGTWGLAVSPYTCVAPQGVKLQVTITYLQNVEGVEADAHGGHAH